MFNGRVWSLGFQIGAGHEPRWSETAAIEEIVTGGVVNSAGGTFTDELEGQTSSDEVETWTVGSIRLEDSKGVPNFEIRE